MPDEYISPEEMRTRGYDRDTIARQERLEIARKEAIKLIADIERVFVDIPRPRITLLVGRGLDNEHFLSPARKMELRAQDPEEDWTMVNPCKVQAYREIFTFGDAYSVRFYLPVLLRYELTDLPANLKWSKDILLNTRQKQFAELTEAEASLCQRYLDFLGQYRL